MFIIQYAIGHYISKWLHASWMMLVLKYKLGTDSTSVSLGKQEDFRNAMTHDL